LIRASTESSITGSRASKRESNLPIHKDLPAILLAFLVSLCPQSLLAGTRVTPELSLDRAAALGAGVSAGVLDLAMSAVSCGVASGDLAVPPTLTIIDYSLPSARPRLWVFDLRSGQLLFSELVAHGRNSGEGVATRFSDAMGSRQSSLGLFRTADAYVGQNGYSLRLDGLEPGFNGHARERAIVMHGAKYVDPAVASANGRVGRSWGCPALREAVARRVIDTVRDGGVIFSYYPDPAWLSTSKFLHCGAAAPATVASN
jgi:hypothetical protein